MCKADLGPVSSSHVRGLSAVNFTLSLPQWDLRSWDERFGVTGNEKGILNTVLL